MSVGEGSAQAAEDGLHVAVERLGGDQAVADGENTTSEALDDDDQLGDEQGQLSQDAEDQSFCFPSATISSLGAGDGGEGFLLMSRTFST